MEVERNLRLIDDRAGKEVEAIAISYLKKVFPNAKVNAIEGAEKQALYGDIKLTLADGKKHYIEVKTSNRFNGADSLVFDYKYYNTNKKGYYIQKNTKSHLGWLWENTLVDWLVVYNKTSKNIYIIDNYQRFRQNILVKLQEHFKTLNESTLLLDLQDKAKEFDDIGEYLLLRRNTFRKAYIVDEYIKLALVEDKSLKLTIGAGTMLNKEFIEAYNGKLYTDCIQLVDTLEKIDKIKEPMLLFN